MKWLVRSGLVCLFLATGCGHDSTVIIYADGGAGSAGASGSTNAGGSNPGTGGAPSAGGSGPTTGGAGGDLGTGGSVTSGGAGEGGNGGGTNCGPGEGLAIQPANGIYPANCVGIAGSVYSYADEMGSYVGVTSDDGHFCVGGTLADATGGGWGGVIEYQLNAPNGESPVPYNASSHGVTGFNFDVTGPQIPSTLQLEYAADGDAQTYCVPLAAGHHDVAFSEAFVDCGSSGATPNPASLTLLRFVFHTTVGAAAAIDFCIDNLAASQ